jgi:uncharacterized integral membrane protein
MTWRLLLSAPLALLLVLFGLSNRHMVALKLWPFDLEWDMPLAVAVLLAAALAFLLGAGIAWASSLPHRRRARRMEAAAHLLEAELNELKGLEARAAATQAGIPQAGTALAPSAAR